MNKARVAHKEHEHKNALSLYSRAAELYMQRLGENVAGDDKNVLRRKAGVSLLCIMLCIYIYIYLFIYLFP